jgi:hypothetical protein
VPSSGPRPVAAIVGSKSSAVSKALPAGRPAPPPIARKSMALGAPVTPRAETPLEAVEPARTTAISTVEVPAITTAEVPASVRAKPPPVTDSSSHAIHSSDVAPMVPESTKSAPSEAAAQAASFDSNLLDPASRVVYIFMKGHRFTAPTTWRGFRLGQKELRKF